MVKKYSKALENWEINSMTGEVWVISDVPNLWRTKTIVQVEKDGYTWDEAGHAIPRVEEEEPKKKK